jgi:adenylosuccinate synthase
MINGVTEIVLTKADVMSNFDTVNICTAYKINGKTVHRMPTETNVKIEPIFTSFKGWKKDICTVRHYDALPEALKSYIQFIENEVNAKISIVSVGPDREATIIR